MLMDPSPVFKFPLWQKAQLDDSPWYPLGGLLEFPHKALPVKKADRITDWKNFTISISTLDLNNTLKLVFK